MPGKHLTLHPVSPGRVNDIKHPNTGDPELWLGTNHWNNQNKLFCFLIFTLQLFLTRL